LTKKKISKLCQIKVVRWGGRRFFKGGHRPHIKLAPLGNRTWLVGVRELVRAPVPEEQKMIAKAVKILRPQLSEPEEEPDWIRWCGKSRFTRDCRQGDTIIRIWRSSAAKRPSVIRQAAPVLLKQQSQGWTRFYLPPANDSNSEMSWGKFQHLLKTLGYARRVGPSIVHLLEPDMADAIMRRWKTLTK